MQAKDEKLDVLYGAPAIAAFTGLTVRQIYHQQANLGLGKLGTILIDVGKASALSPTIRTGRCSRIAGSLDNQIAARCETPARLATRNQAKALIATLELRGLE